jgi:hypothetical protein
MQSEDEGSRRSPVGATASVDSRAVIRKVGLRYVGWRHGR